MTQQHFINFENGESGQPLTSELVIAGNPNIDVNSLAYLAYYETPARDTLSCSVATDAEFPFGDITLKAVATAPGVTYATAMEYYEAMGLSAFYTYEQFVDLVLDTFPTLEDFLAYLNSLPGPVEVQPILRIEAQVRCHNYGMGGGGLQAPLYAYVETSGVTHLYFIRSMDVSSAVRTLHWGDQYALTEDVVDADIEILEDEWMRWSIERVSDSILRATVANSANEVIATHDWELATDKPIHQAGVGLTRTGPTGLQWWADDIALTYTIPDEIEPEIDEEAESVRRIFT